MSAEASVSASGIVTEGSQRLIPESRRADGSMRKERKVKPGFTPAEDIGKFRSVRVEARKAGEPSEQLQHALASGDGSSSSSSNNNAGVSASRWSNSEGSKSPHKVMLRTSSGIADGALSPSSKKTVPVDDDTSFPALSPPSTTPVPAKPSRAELDADGRWKKTPLPENEEARPKSKADEATSWRRGGGGGGAPSTTRERQAGPAKTQATKGASTSRWAHAEKKANDKDSSAKSKNEKSGDDLVKELNRLDLK